MEWNVDQSVECCSVLDAGRYTRAAPHHTNLRLSQIKACTLQLGLLPGRPLSPKRFLRLSLAEAGIHGPGSGKEFSISGRDTGELGCRKNLTFGYHLARDLRLCAQETTRKRRNTKQCLPTTQWGQDKQLQHKQRLGVPRVGGNHSAPSGCHT